MTINLDNIGLKKVASEFDHFFIDIWGVLHDGIKLSDEAVNTLTKLENSHKDFTLLTNAPRPNRAVKDYLKNMGLDANKCQKVFTSGEASLKYLTNELKNKSFFHVGSSRDFDLFKDFKKNKVLKIEKSDFILCTGLFDDIENLEFYKNLFLNNTKKIFVCTNPDLIVYRGNKKELCAGSVAKIFEKMGGKVKYFGKPHSLVYESAIKIKKKKIICIGDNLNTDIKGANNLGFSSLLITNGIHKNEENNNLEKLFLKYNVNVDFTLTNLKW